MIRRTSMLMFLVLALCLSGLQLLAQSAGTIEGTVTDTSGAVVPNATVTITNKAPASRERKRPIRRVVQRSCVGSRRI